MTHMRLKIAVGVGMLVLGFGFLAFAGMRKVQVYYVEVDTLLADGQFHNQRIRLCGTVGAEGIQVDPKAATLRFELLGKQAKVPVVYQGLAPQMFKAGAAVVAEGKMDEAGVFQATQLLTKCASKYQPADDPVRQPSGHGTPAVPGSDAVASPAGPGPSP
jgi:cytochrome c-type biogenesis protein CcmE